MGNNLFLTNRRKYDISKGYEWLEIRNYAVGKGFGNQIRGSFMTVFVVKNKLLLRETMVENNASPSPRKIQQSEIMYFCG